MSKKLIIDGNAVYEIDLDCVSCRENEIYMKEEHDQKKEKKPKKN